jgi:hypothetical protein
MTNVGSIDRGARVLVGLILIALLILPPNEPAFGGLGPWSWVVAAIGLVMLATAAFRFCPAYTFFG